MPSDELQGKHPMLLEISFIGSLSCCCSDASDTLTSSMGSAGVWPWKNLTSRLPFRFSTTWLLLQHSLLSQEVQSSGVELIYRASMNPEQRDSEIIGCRKINLSHTHNQSWKEVWIKKQKLEGSCDWWPAETAFLVQKKNQCLFLLTILPLGISDETYQKLFQDSGNNWEVERIGSQFTS